MMRRNISGARTIAWLLVMSAWGAGCSLINTFDELVPQKQNQDSGIFVDSSVPLDAGPDVTMEAAKEAGIDSSVDVGVDAGPHGAIVIGGAATGDGPDKFVLTALDPATGTELPNAREPMLVSAVLYDPLNDLWYIFESGGQGIFPLPTDDFFVRTRQLDPISGQWTELSKVAIPPGISFATATVLHDRITYVAYPAADAGMLMTDDGGSVPVGFDLVTLDTSTPSSVTVSSVIPFAGKPPIALLGTPSIVNQGGFATFAVTSATRTALLTPVLLPAGASPPSVEQPIVGAYAVGGQTGYGSVQIGTNLDIAVVGRGFGPPTTPATVAIYDPIAAANDPTTALVGAGTFSFLDGNVKPPAFSKCTQTLFVVGTNADLNLHAVSLGDPLPMPDGDGGLTNLSEVTVPTGHSGQAVYFEPFTNTVLVPFSQGDNYSLSAFTFEGGQFTARQPPLWVPPADLRPNFIATRTPLSFPCTGPVQSDP
jgi:hypothetical protein